MMDKNPSDPLRLQLARLLDWEEAHVGFDKAIDGLPTDQRGRGRALRLYSQGEWKQSEGLLPHITPFATHPSNWTPPNLGPEQFTLSFDVPARPGDFYVTDPRLVVLTRVLPPAGDPMLEIEDQMNRYEDRAQSSGARLRAADVSRERAQEREEQPQLAPEQDAPPSQQPVTPPAGGAVEP